MIVFYRKEKLRILNLMLEDIKKESHFSGLCLHFHKHIREYKGTLKGKILFFWFTNRLPKHRYTFGGYPCKWGHFCFPYGSGETESERFNHYRIMWILEQIHKLKK